MFCSSVSLTVHTSLTRTRPNISDLIHRAHFPISGATNSERFILEELNWQKTRIHYQGAYVYSMSILKEEGKQFSTDYKYVELKIHELMVDATNLQMEDGL